MDHGTQSLWPKSSCNVKSKVERVAYVLLNLKDCRPITSFHQEKPRDDKRKRKDSYYY